jgi:hypothetical protein
MYNNVIGYKGTPEERLEYWLALKVYNRTKRELLNNKDTIDIAIEDGKRYTSLLKEYVKKAA